MYTASAQVNDKRANYYLPVQREDGPSSCKKRRDVVSHPPRTTTRILGRKYALTSTAYKYLEIGISVGPVSTVEILIGDNRGNKLILPTATWRTLMEKRDEIQRFLHADNPSTSPLWIRDLAVEYCKMGNSNIVKLALSSSVAYLKPDTVNTLFNFEHCIDHMYAWLCENTHLVNTKFRNFVNVICEKNIPEMCYEAKGIGEDEVRHATKAIRESEFYDGESLIDCELLACSLKDLILDAFNK